jgi:hypothetical protein
MDEGGAVPGLCESIRHRHHDGFLQAEHIAEVDGKVAEHRQLGGTGIAENRRQPEFPQQRMYGVANHHFAVQRGITIHRLASSRSC